MRDQASRKLEPADLLFDVAVEAIDSATAVVFIIDDDPSVLTSLERLLRVNGYLVETYRSSAAFLARQSHKGPGCILVDLKMPEIGGLELQQKLTESGQSLPVIFMSGVGDIPSTVRAIQGGALDFMEKPIHSEALLQRVGDAVNQHRRTLKKALQRRERQMRFARLTSREREVAQLVGEGLSNKEIAATLGTAEKTIKHHRARMMLKLDVGSVAELVRLLDHIGASRQER